MRNNGKTPGTMRPSRRAARVVAPSPPVWMQAKAVAALRRLVREGCDPNRIVADLQVIRGIGCSGYEAQRGTAKDNQKVVVPIATPTLIAGASALRDAEGHLRFASQHFLLSWLRDVVAYIQVVLPLLVECAQPTPASSRAELVALMRASLAFDVYAATGAWHDSDVAVLYSSSMRGVEATTGGDAQSRWRLRSRA